MPHSTLRITTLGAPAWQVLSQAHEATVWGATSRGVFLHTASGWIVFLSSEKYRGPLTLNVKDLTGFDNLSGLARVDEDGLTFDQTGVRLGWRGAATWEAPPTPEGDVRLDEAMARVEAVWEMVRDARTSPTPPTPLPLLALRTSFDRSQERGGGSRGVDEGLLSLLGQGAGLTPAGDDNILGYLLTLSRWGHALPSCPDAQAISRLIVPAAYRQTTTLSANLIECAAQGQADERLILALDGILTGWPDAVTCAAYLAGWGSSSGGDALAGMALALDVGKVSLSLRG